MKNEIEFIRSAVSAKDYPKWSRPALAFIGRSNVGKSSLINALYKTRVAKISAKPGKTQTLNFYLVNQKYYVVDLPGYGYASVSKGKKILIGTFVDEFLTKYQDLKLIVILLDFRHPLQKIDEQMLDYLRAAQLDFIVALTKTDKVPKTKFQKQLKYFQNAISDIPLFPASSVKNRGIFELAKELERIVTGE